MEHPFCTYCGREGHRAPHCPWRVGAFWRVVARFARRVVCRVLSCKPALLHCVKGLHDGRIRGVWECIRCGRVWLGGAA